MTRIDPRPPVKAAHRAPASPARQLTTAVLVGAALLQVWLIFYALVLSPLQAHHSQGVLYSKFREQLANQTAPVGGTPIGVGKPVALIDFPAAGVKREVVVEGTASSDLAKGVGHLRSSVLPGQVGLSELLGRAQLYGAPFGRLASVHLGSIVTVTTGEGISKYSVYKVSSDGPKPSATNPWPAGDNSLVMATAASSGWRSGWAPSKAVFVYARLQTEPYLGSAGVAIPKVEQPMKGDPSALYVLVLWIPLLFAAVMGVLWAVARWGRWQAWLVGVPVILATLWGFGSSVLQLLPNLT